MVSSIVIASLLGACGGEWLRRWANRLAYRRPEEARQLPPPGRRLWIPVVVGLAWAAAVWWLWPGEPSVRAYASILNWLALSLVGVYLAAVDFDVRRLPDRAQILLAATAVAGAVLLCWAQPVSLLAGGAGALTSGAGFWLIHALSRGALGFGDVKLAATCGFILGLVSWQAVFAGFLVASVLALAYSLATRARQFAYGPWLLGGTMIAGLGLGQGPA